MRCLGCLLDQRTGEMQDLQCRLIFKGLVEQSEKLREYFGKAALEPCYEAAHVSFSFQRDLRGRS